MTELIAAAFAVLKRLPWKQIALALAALALALLLWRAPWAESRQKSADYAHFQPKLAKALERENIAARSLTSASNALRVQGASIKALATAEAVKLADAQRIIAEARKLDADRNATIAKLRASAAKPIAGAPCEASAATKETWQ